jgi:hypothetical protein
MATRNESKFADAAFVHSSPDMVVNSKGKVQEELPPAASVYSRRDLMAAAVKMGSSQEEVATAWPLIGKDEVTFEEIKDAILRVRAMKV